MLGTPCFAEEYEILRRALRSFQEPDVDVVAIDNGGSLDVKRAISDEFEATGAIEIIRNERNVYVNPAWNQLATRFLDSDAEILVVANADLVVAPGWSKTLLARHQWAALAKQRELWFGRATPSIEEASNAHPSSIETTVEAAGDRSTFGSFFAMPRAGVRIAFPIPSEVLIWYGDGWIHNILSEAGYHNVILRNVVCWHKGGMSSERVPERTQITAREKIVWDSYLGNVCRTIGAKTGNENMDEIERQFTVFRDTPADINEHMQKLCDYARECEHVTEFGTGRSTWAFLNARPKTLRCYDIGGGDFLRQERVAAEAGIDFRFEQADTGELTIEPTDLLFIDTYHVYRQLRTELELHGHKARKYILMHDTEIFGDRSEDGSVPGLWEAIEEFVTNHPEWRVVERLANNNGLTVLKR
jgi:plasmid stability protein